MTVADTRDGPPTAPTAPTAPPLAGRAIAAGAPGTGRKVVVSTVAQVGAKVVHLVLNVVSTLAVIHHLAPGEYGVYALVLMVTTLTGLLADFGLPHLAVREIGDQAGDPGREARVVGSVLVLRLPLAVAAIGLTQVAITVLGMPGSARLPALVASATCLGEAVLGAVLVLFQVRLAQHVEAWVRTATEVLETSAVLVLVAGHAGIVALFVPQAVGAALSGVVLFTLARRRFGLRPRMDPVLARQLLVAALPVAGALVIGVLYRRVDSLALGALRSPSELGVYAAAVQPVEYAWLTNGLVMNVVFPLLSAAHAAGARERLHRLYRAGAGCLVAGLVAVPLVLLFVARPVATTVFGDAYAGSALPLVLLTCALVPTTVATWQALVLLLVGQQKVTLLVTSAALLVAVATALPLVHLFGTTGAGVSAVITALAALAGTDLAVRRLAGLQLDRGRLLAVGVAAAAAAAVLAGTSLLGVPWLLQVPVGLVAYAAALRVTGVHRCVREVLA